MIVIERVISSGASVAAMTWVEGSNSSQMIVWVKQYQEKYAALARNSKKLEKDAR